ncbi:hypothetical protein KY284_031675 [Solanum tuberosum]|nr:hypothetical protein KY284_031675 [Solanum tuberosum]
MILTEITYYDHLTFLYLYSTIERFFKECQRPSEDQQNQLGRKVGLDPKQIMIWFQNKRAQTKAKDEKSDNHTLRKENEYFHCEIMAMKEKKKINMCPQCDGPSIGEEQRMRNLENLKMESQRMREEHSGLWPNQHQRTYEVCSLSCEEFEDLKLM